jgi:hypothetical protein
MSKPTYDAPLIRATVEVVDDLLVVLDEDGNGCDCYELRGLRRATEQIKRWQRQYTFDYAKAMHAVRQFFAAR